MLRRLALISVFMVMVMGTVAVTSCSTHRHVVHSKSSPKIGPPPHAPAHGYRHKHRHGVELIYDAELKVYVVAKHPHHYYRDDCYYREGRKGWEISASIEGPWKAVADDKLPSGLQKKAKKNKETKEDKNKQGSKSNKGKSKGSW
jgi:hypothetical protein